MVKGLERKFDDLGRVTVPIEMRRSLNIEDRGMVDIYLDNGIICLKPSNTVICPRGEFVSMKPLCDCTDREIVAELSRRFS